MTSSVFTRIATNATTGTVPPMKQTGRVQTNASTVVVSGHGVTPPGTFASFTSTTFAALTATTFAQTVSM